MRGKPGGCAREKTGARATNITGGTETPKYKSPTYKKKGKKGKRPYLKSMKKQPDGFNPVTTNTGPWGKKTNSEKN